jgi:HSP20 family molecular chaperone IbpA
MSEVTHPSTELQSRVGDVPGTDVSRGGELPATSAAIVPPVDVFEDADGILLYADLPGVPKERLDVKVEGDSLFIDAQASLDVPAQLKVLHAEMREPRYRRAFTLSQELDASRIDASLKDGVLTLRIPRVEEAKPRRITVRAD